MWIFVRGIPREMDSRALDRFIKRLLFPGWLPFIQAGRIRIAGSKILKIVHTRSHTVEFHGLIQVMPADRAKRVIDRINQAKIDGRQLHAHTYNKRFIRGDRRKTLFDPARTLVHERRQVERRRKHLVSQVVDATLRTPPI